MAALERLGNIRSANASDGFPTSPVDVAAGGGGFFGARIKQARIKREMEKSTNKKNIYC
jgi:hypothetical protein